MGAFFLSRCVIPSPEFSRNVIPFEVLIRKILSLSLCIFHHHGMITDTTINGEQSGRWHRTPCCFLSFSCSRCIVQEPLDSHEQRSLYCIGRALLASLSSELSSPRSSSLNSRPNPTDRCLSPRITGCNRKNDYTKWTK